MKIEQIEKQYLALQQKHRYQHVKIDLLDMQDRPIGSFTGVALSGSINKNGDSTYRRTASLDLLLTQNLVPAEGGMIWFGRKIQLNIGITLHGEVIWFSMGRYVIKSANINKSSGTRKLSLELLDYMALLDGTLFGNISHNTEIKVKSGVTVNEAIAITVDELPKVSIDRFEVNGMDMVIPYDMEFNHGSNVYDIVKKLVELYMGQEFYFDRQGIFRVERIRNKDNDPVVWDFTDKSMDISVGYSRKLDFANVKNAVWVWGKMDKFGKQHFWCYRNEYNIKTKDELNTINDMQIGSLCYIEDKGLTYGYDGEEWVETDIKVTPMFNITNIGERIYSISEDTIQTEEQAKLRAEYELEDVSHFAEVINISTIPIYILEPNTKIKVKDSETGINGDYLIKTINTSLGKSGVMNITAEKIYY